MSSQTNNKNAALLQKFKDIIAKSNLPADLKANVRDMKDPNDAERVIAHILVGSDYKCDKSTRDSLIKLLKEANSTYMAHIDPKELHPSPDASSERSPKRAKTAEQPAKVVPRMMTAAPRLYAAVPPAVSTNSITLTKGELDEEECIIVKTVTNRDFGDARDSLARDNDGIERPDFRYVNIYVPMKELEGTGVDSQRELEFVKDLEALLGNENNALLFVHGFNTSLRSSSLYAAKLRHLQNCRGDTYLFDWACPMRDGKSWYQQIGDALSLLSDNKDCKKRVQKQSTHQELRNLINKLVAHYESVVVICHSMGCDLFTRAFDKAHLLPDKKEFRQKFSLLFFAADAETQRAESMMENRDLNVFHRYNGSDKALLGDMASSFFRPAGLDKIQHWKCKVKEGGDTHSYLLEREYWDQFKQMNNGRYHSLLNAELLRKSDSLSMSKVAECELSKCMAIMDRKF